MDDVLLDITTVIGPAEHTVYKGRRHAVVVIFGPHDDDFCRQAKLEFGVADRNDVLAGREVRVRVELV